MPSGLSPLIAVWYLWINRKAMQDKPLHSTAPVNAASPQRSGASRAIPAFQSILDYPPHLSQQFVHVPERNLVFCLTPKVANTAFAVFLRRVRGACEVQGKANVHEVDDGGLPRLSEYDREARAQAFGGTTVLFVREPAERLLSAWLDKWCAPSLQSVHPAWTQRAHRLGWLDVVGESPAHFRRFAERACAQKIAARDPHWGLQLYTSGHHLTPYQHVGRFEDLSADVERIFAATLGIETPFPTHAEARMTNQNTGDRMAEYFTTDLIDLVAEAYAEDYQAFGYDKPVIEPFASEMSQRECRKRL